MVTLAILTSIFLLLNKALLVINRKAQAWICGIIGMGGLAFFLYLEQAVLCEHPKNLLIMVISNTSGIPIMSYALMIVIFKKSDTLEKKLEKWKLFFTFCIIVFSVALCTFFFVRLLNADLVLEQFLLSLIATVGTLLLSFDKRMTNMWGWILLVPTHALSAYIMFKIDTPIIAIGQLLSIPFAVYGYYLERYKIILVSQ